MPKKTSKKETTPKPISTSYLDRIEAEVQANQSKFNLVLGGLIVLIIGLLLFNYFKKDNQPELAPAQHTNNQQINVDASPDNLPGKYTVKDGDTLFQIAQKYYNDGYQYPALVKANNLSDPDVIEVGQIINIPKLENISSPTPTTDSNQWGSIISGNTYTVTQGDWLSTIAARAYNGDVMSYTKIAQANNIQDPNNIEPGTVLTIPR